MVSIGNAAANGQTDACALVFIAPVQPLKHRKYFLQVFLLKADAIVLDAEFAKLFSRERSESAGANLDHGLCAGALKLQSVPEQVQQQLVHLHWVGVHYRQVSYFQLRARLFDPHFEIAENSL